LRGCSGSLPGSRVLTLIMLLLLLRGGSPLGRCSASEVAVGAVFRFSTALQDSRLSRRGEDGVLSKQHNRQLADNEGVKMQDEESTPRGRGGGVD